MRLAGDVGGVPSRRRPVRDEAMFDQLRGTADGSDERAELAAHRHRRQTAAAQKKNQSECLNDLTGAAVDAVCGGVPEGLPAVFTECVDGLGSGLEVGVEDDAYGTVVRVDGG